MIHHSEDFTYVFFFFEFSSFSRGKKLRRGRVVTHLGGRREERREWRGVYLWCECRS